MNISTTYSCFLPRVHVRSRRQILICLAASIISLSISGCAFLHQVQESELIGRYRCITDFSRDIMSMKGNVHTVVYKNGRQETIRLLADHSFSRKVHFTSDRVKDEKMRGIWRLDDNGLIEVTAPPKHPSPSKDVQRIDYYQFERSKGIMIRLNAHKRKLAPEYAPYYTFYRL